MESSKVKSSFNLSLDSPLHVFKTSITSCLFLLSSSVQNFTHCNLSSYVCRSMLLIISCKSPLNLLDHLLVFYIMRILSTDTVFDMRPNRCFTQTQHYPDVPKPYCPRKRKRTLWFQDIGISQEERRQDAVPMSCVYICKQIFSPQSKWSIHVRGVRGCVGWLTQGKFAVGLAEA